MVTWLSNLELPTWTDVTDAGAVVLATASDGRIYSLKDISGTFTLRIIFFSKRLLTIKLIKSIVVEMAVSKFDPSL